MTKSEFVQKKWGVFCHYLHSLHNGNGPHNTRGQVTSWEECVNELNVEKLASQISDLGAGYLVFTMQQGSRHFIAPSRSFVEATGLTDACSSRDLVLDLSSALSKRGIDLFLYYTGDGMPRDAEPEVCKRFGWQQGTEISWDLVKMWSEPLREYSLRYGNKVSGWWLDGMYDAIGYTDEKLLHFRQAAQAGNPDALIANNYYGCFVPDSGKEVQIDGKNVILADFYQNIAPPTPFCDFTAGEVVQFNAYPDPTRTWDVVPHVLSFLGIPEKAWEVYAGWGAGGCKYSPEYMARYIQGVNHLGGVVSVDMRLYRDGSLEDAQRRALELVGKV